MIVVDASVGVKWFMDEPFSIEARSLLRQHQGDIVAPDLFVVEVVGALVRRANMVKAKRGASEAAIVRFRALLTSDVLVATPSPQQTVADAAAIALDLGHPLKDCLYLALAIERACPLVTADARFAAKARDAWARVRVLGAEG